MAPDEAVGKHERESTAVQVGLWERETVAAYLRGHLVRGLAVKKCGNVLIHLWTWRSIGCVAPAQLRPLPCSEQDACDDTSVFLAGLGPTEEEWGTRWQLWGLLI